MLSKLSILSLALPTFIASLLGAHQGGVLVLQSNAGGTAVNSPASAGTSLNWSGYDATGGTFTGAGASWIMPTASAASSSLSADATWVGVGGVSSHDLIQAGTQTIFQNGTPTYTAWYETLPSDSVTVPLTVHPGDAMTVSIAEQSGDTWLVSFVDATTGQNYSTEVNYQSSLSSAEWVEEMPSDQRGFVALDSFGAFAFTNAFAIENGNHVTISAANGQSMTMINNANQALATTSALGSDGANFTVSRTDIASGASAEQVGFGNGSGRGYGRWSRTGVGVQGFAPTPHANRGSGRGFLGIDGDSGTSWRTLEQNFYTQFYSQFGQRFIIRIP